MPAQVGRPRLLTPAQEREVVRLMKTRMWTADEVAYWSGVSRRTVYNIVKRVQK